jgi:type II secretory pathway pseudopilin PulG
MRNLQRGISLLEILLSLAIAGVLVMMMVNYYNAQAKTQLLISKAAEQIQQLSSISYEWQTAQSQVDFIGISLTALQDAGLIRDNYLQQNPWGNSISVAPANDNPQYVLINLGKVPQDVCSNLRERMAHLAHSQASTNDCTQGNYYISL